MLIRSQDKKQIIPFENFVFSTYGSSIICSKDIIGHPSEFAKRRVAVYSTEEKAIKVLDMIQKEYSRCVTGNVLMSGRINRINEMASEIAECCVRNYISMQVFQMPQDSEV